jgi:hypothetical protein
MKKIFLATFAAIALAGAAKAQQTFSTEYFNKHLGKTGTLCDTIYSFHIVSDTLTLLNMGGNYPKQKYTVAIKGNRISLDWVKIKGKPLCVTGVFELYKNRPEIEITEPDRINMKQ